MTEEKTTAKEEVREEKIVIEEETKMTVEKMAKKDQPLELDSLFKAGVYFGHKRSRRNPLMDEYVYTYREGVAIIDLQKTLELFKESLDVMESLVAQGKPILFVGTKKHVKNSIKNTAESLGMPYVSNRWLGGTFTNFSVIRGRVKYLIDLEEKIQKGELSGYTKFERLKKQEEVDKMEEKLGGLRTMEQLPGAVFILDAKEDHLAIKEAKRAGVPVIGLIDTNDDPRGISYVIPGNNDALSSVSFILAHVALAVERGLKKRKEIAQAPKDEKKI
jgi:small subunit ribosomal protein S2